MQAKNSEKLLKCFSALEDYDGLEQLLATLPESSPLLWDLGEIFQTAGLCQQAIKAFLMAGDPKRAVDCCIILNKWNQAVDLAAAQNFPQVEQLLEKYAMRLIENNKVIDAVVLYKRANRHMEGGEASHGSCPKIFRKKGEATYAWLIAFLMKINKQHG